jgi:hypothetical protein
MMIYDDFMIMMIFMIKWWFMSNIVFIDNLSIYGIYIIIWFMGPKMVKNGIFRGGAKTSMTYSVYYIYTRGV